MKAVLALAFLAFAKAAIFERPIFDDGIWHKDMDSIWMRHLIHDHHKIHPTYMRDFEGMDVLNKFYKPSLVFFEDPDGKIISYYANDGIDKIGYTPEVKTAFTDLYGAADKVGVHYRPEDILGDYKTVLGGRFFEPENTFALNRYMHDMPASGDFSHLKFPGKSVHPTMKSFDIDTLPFFYKSPVNLDMNKFLSDATVVPTTHGITGWPMVSGASVVPFGKSGVTPFHRSGLTPAYHLVKADYPFFTAAPAGASSGLVDSAATGFPLFKTAASPYLASDSGLAFAPVHASGIIPATAGGVPLVKAAPCVGEACFVGDMAFASEGIVPLVKAAPCLGEGCLVGGDFGFAPSAGASYFRSAFPTTFGAHHGMTYSPLVKTMPLATSHFASPATVAYSPAHSIIPLKF